MRRQVTYEKQYLNHALLIMNNFTGEDRGLELTESMFRNMFPNINVITELSQASNMNHVYSIFTQTDNISE